eukprot:8326715-Pyramimonas_sp.AAC.1
MRLPFAVPRRPPSAIFESVSYLQPGVLKLRGAADPLEVPRSTAEPIAPGGRRPWTWDALPSRPRKAAT